MPLEIRAFVKLPVIASAKSPSPGKALASYAVLFTDLSKAEETEVASPFGGRAGLRGQSAAMSATPANAASERQTAVFA